MTELRRPTWREQDDAKDGLRTFTCEVCAQSFVSTREHPDVPPIGLIILAADASTWYVCGVEHFLTWVRAMMPGYSIERKKP